MSGSVWQFMVCVLLCGCMVLLYGCMIWFYCMVVVQGWLSCMAFLHVMTGMSCLVCFVCLVCLVCGVGGLVGMSLWCAARGLEHVRVSIDNCRDFKVHIGRMSHSKFHAKQFLRAFSPSKKTCAEQPESTYGGSVASRSCRCLRNFRQLWIIRLGAC